MFSFSGFCIFSLYFDLQLQAVVYLRVIDNLYIAVMALVGFGTSAVQVLAYQKSKNRDYNGVAEQKDVWRTMLYNGFRFVLGYRDWPTLNTQWRRLS